MNSLLLTLTAVLILVLSALFAAPLFIDWNDYRPAFEQQASKLLGREVKVGGQVHLIVLPAPQLKFDDVKVAGEDGSLDKPFLEAKSLEAKIDVGTLLTGRVEAHQLTIVDPTLRLEIKSDGTGNWGDVGRPGVPAPFAPKDVLLDSVQVSGGTVEIVMDGARKFVLSNIDGEASAASLSGPYKVSAAYDFEGRRQTLRFSTGAMDAAGKFRLKAALRDPGRSTNYQLDGAVTGLGGTPAYDGTILMRIANLAAAQPALEEAAVETLPAESEPEIESELAAESEPAPIGDTGAPSGPRDTATFVELKGDLKATPDRAELPEFDLTIHAAGRPQILKGSLDLDFREPFKADGKLAARWVDLDALLAASPADEKPSPTEVLYMFAEWVLDETASIGEGALTLDVEQASLGGDLVGGLDMQLAGKDGGVTIERLKAVLPGDNRIAVSGRLRQGELGPVFSGPIEISGSGLRTLTRWAAGDREMSGRASAGEFALSALLTIGDGELKLADANGEVSDTKFRGLLNYQAGDTNLIEVTLESDRLDLREMLGDGPIWSAWLSANGEETAPSEDSGKDTDLLAQLRDDDVRATLTIGELLLPDIPSGKLDAKLGLVDGTLDIEALEFLAPGAIALSGNGRVANVADAPTGSVDLSLQAQTTDALRVLTDLFGLPEDVRKSKHLSALAPLDVRAGLVATGDSAATRASLELSGQVGNSDIAVVARAKGAPAELADAEIDIAGSVTGERPQAFLVLLFPDLPQDRLASAGTQGKLSVRLNGVPRTKLTGRGALETGAMQLAFEGQGSLKEDAITLNGYGSIATQDASLALPLLGIDAPPSANNVPLTFSANVAKNGATLDLDSVKAKIDGNAIEGSAHFERDGAMTNFKIAANADYVSLPAVLGILVAWGRTTSTEEMLGSITDAADVWPARGFALDIIDSTQGDITLNAKTLSLATPFQVADATLNAKVDNDGLTVTDLDGTLFGGVLSASGALSPRGGGAALNVSADLKGGQLEALSENVAGKTLANGLFHVNVTAQGEGLSPPGIVAGLSGKGSLLLGDGTILGLSPKPLRAVAATAANTKIKATKAQIDADAETVRNTLTSGEYAYAPVQAAFEIKNGTLRFKPMRFVGSGAETDVSAYVELASLKLDSEWQMRLQDTGGVTVPPVSVVFVGPLEEAGAISPAIDTTAIESHLTMRRMQEDVERLETLDVSGRSASQDAAQAEAQAKRAAEAEAAAERAAVEAKEAAEQAAREKAEAEQRAAAEAEAAAERAAAEQAAREKADAERKAAAEAKIAAEKEAAKQAAREKAEAEARAAAEAKAQAAAQAAAKAQAAAEAKAEAEAKAAAEAEAVREAREAAERAAKERAAAEAQAEAEAKAAAQAKAAAAQAKAAAERAVQERAAAEAKAAAERAARQRIEAEANAAAEAAEAARAAEAASAAEAARAAAAARAADAARAAAAARAATEANATAAVPDGLLPPVPPDGASSDPIAEMLAGDGETATDAEVIDEETVVEETPKPAPRRYRRKRSRPDDWKKNYSIFGGGF